LVLKKGVALDLFKNLGIENRYAENASSSTLLKKKRSVNVNLVLVNLKRKMAFL